MTNKVDVLDHGYVRLVDSMGSDLTVVNSARVSFNKESEWEEYFEAENTITLRDSEGIPKDYFYQPAQFRLKAADKRLLKYLAEHGHWSPFRHCVLSFEIYAPMMVVRQWGKYRVGSVFSFEDSDDPIETWNESSRRYVTEEPEFYIPEVWRRAPENKKQGSGEAVNEESQTNMQDEYEDRLRRSFYSYNYALDLGVCAEQARLFLPAYALYIRARWTVSLQGVIHFLQQRLQEDSQWEIQQFAAAVRDLAKPLFPESFEVMGL